MPAKEIQQGVQSELAITAKGYDYGTIYGYWTVGSDFSTIASADYPSGWLVTLNTTGAWTLWVTPPVGSAGDVELGVNYRGPHTPGQPDYYGVTTCLSERFKVVGTSPIQGWWCTLKNGVYGCMFGQRADLEASGYEITQLQPYATQDECRGNCKKPGPGPATGSCDFVGSG